ncbi:unnamed protein product, partial [Rotaria sp. Silwood2]
HFLAQQPSPQQPAPAGQIRPPPQQFEPAAPQTLPSQQTSQQLSPQHTFPSGQQ